MVCYNALYDSGKDMLTAICLHIGDRTDKLTALILGMPALIDQILIFHIIGGIPAHKACGIDTRCAIQRIDGKTAVIRNHLDSQTLMNCLCLNQGIFFKGCPCFLNLDILL